MFNNGFLKWNWASAISAIVIAAAATATATPPASASFIEDMRRNCPCFNPGRIAATRGHLQFALLSHSCHNLWLFYLHTYFNFHVHLYFHRRSCHRVLGVPNPCNLLGSWQTNILSTTLSSFAALEGLLPSNILQLLQGRENLMRNVRICAPNIWINSNENLGFAHMFFGLML